MIVKLFVIVRLILLLFGCLSGWLVRFVDWLAGRDDLLYGRTNSSRLSCDYVFHFLICYLFACLMYLSIAIVCVSLFYFLSCVCVCLFVLFVLCTV